MLHEITYRVNDLDWNSRPHKRAYSLIHSSSVKQAKIAFKRSMISREETYVLIDVQRLNNEWETRDRQFWNCAWNRAMHNMPHRLMRQKTIEYLIRDKVPIPEFIEKRARGTMYLDDEGRVCEKAITLLEPVKYGQMSVLGLLLNYMTTYGAQTKKPRINNCAVSKKMRYGERPRDIWKRKLLIALASSEGNAIARRMLTQRGIIHRYEG